MSNIQKVAHSVHPSFAWESTANPPECLAASFRSTSSKCVQVSHILTRLLGNLMVVPPEASGALGLLHGLRLRLTSHPAKCLCFCDPRGLFQKMSLMRAFVLGRGQWEIRQKQKLLIGLVYFCSLGIQAFCVVDFGSQGTSPQVDVLNVSHTHPGKCPIVSYLQK